LVFGDRPSGKDCSRYDRKPEMIMFLMNIDLLHFVSY
jgi:hypothetical protein